MAKQKVTQERYEHLKIVLDSANASSALYEALNISNSTASRIKRSKNFQEYRLMSKTYHQKPKKENPNQIKISPLAPPEENDYTKILKLLDKIDTRLDLIEAMINSSNNTYKLPKYKVTGFFGGK